jgi:hypothetical protein
LWVFLGEILNRHNKNWTEDETNYLVDNIVEKGVTRVSSELGRSEGAVLSRLWRSKSSRLITSCHIIHHLGVNRNTANNWLTRGYFGKSRVIKTNHNNGKFHKRFIDISSLWAMISDPLYEWLVRICDLSEEARKYCINYSNYYVDRHWIAKRCYVHHTTVHVWFRRGIIPTLRTPYRIMTGMQMPVTPRQLADEHIEKYLTLKCDGGLEIMPEIKLHNIELARKLSGFDREVAVPWRDAWKWE